MSEPKDNKILCATCRLMVDQVCGNWGRCINFRTYIVTQKLKK